MSELLARCAMLHGMADALESLWFHNTASEVHRAADTISELRELVLDMWQGMCDHDRCGTCEHWQGGYNGCKYHASMIKLGVIDE